MINILPNIINNKPNKYSHKYYFICIKYEGTSLLGHLHCPEGGQACSELKLSSWLGLAIPGSVQSQWSDLFYWKVTLPMGREWNLVILKIPFNHIIL